MELKVEDLYQIQCMDCLSTDAISSLMNLYQPIVGNHAISMYLTLLTEGIHQHIQETHLRLSKILHLGIDEIQRSRSALEGMFLLKTFVKKMGQFNLYLYVLQPPLSCKNFNSNRIFLAMLQEAIGTKELESTLAKFNSKHISIEGYEEITTPVIHRPYSYDYEVQPKLETIQPKYQFLADETIQFDYEAFFRNLTPLQLPLDQRTPENLGVIGKIATVQGIPPDRMRILAGRSLNLKTKQLDIEKLKILANREQPDVTPVKDPYLLPPVSFLQSKQNGIPVSFTDRKILEKIAINHHFSTEIINIMIEYILKIDQNRLRPSVVDTIIGEWARDGVDSREKAIAQTKKRRNHYKKPVNTLPSYMTETQSQEVVDDTSRQEVEELLRKMGNINE